MTSSEDYQPVAALAFGAHETCPKCGEERRFWTIQWHHSVDLVDDNTRFVNEYMLLKCGCGYPMFEKVKDA